jgi:hypothetical protein
VANRESIEASEEYGGGNGKFCMIALYLRGCLKTLFFAFSTQQNFHTVKRTGFGGTDTLVCAVVISCCANGQNSTKNRDIFVCAVVILHSIAQTRVSAPPEENFVVY